jgi:uncharacterized protein
MNTSSPLALVTGASSGIGEIFARKLSGMGCRLLLVARRKSRLEQLAAEIGNAEVLSADLAEDIDLRRVEERIHAEPDLEFLINNAGFGTLGRFFETALEGQDRMHRLHVLATMRLTHAALPGMVRRRKGSVINVSSVAGFLQNPNNVSYCATKCWINKFTEGIYLELKSIGSPVRVQALCPGFTRSEFHDTLGVDRNQIPRIFWMSAENVVDASLRGLERGKLFVVPGGLYRFFIASLLLLPRPVRHGMSLWYGRRKLLTSEEKSSPHPPPAAKML